MIGPLILLLALAGAEERAIDFLAREVPSWPQENGCFSCHNNGDAARALFAAVRLDHHVPAESMRETLAWLARPEGWADQKGEEAFSDVVLTRVQFASALADAIDAGLIDRRDALARAAELVASDQTPLGSWKLDASGSIGSPATYGEALATVTARRVLVAADSGFVDEIGRADRYLRELDVKTVLDAAAVLSALADANDAAAVGQRRKCLEVIESGQAPSGGWGPYVTSRPEPFDTALVVLSLASLGGHEDLVANGRGYLLESQLDDGSWPETTRPAGQISYAQYISTTGWALLALLASED